jgi:2-keto-3-deoxy-L-rhamnonate aldolase RhmA
MDCRRAGMVDLLRFVGDRFVGLLRSRTTRDAKKASLGLVIMAPDGPDGVWCIDIVSTGRIGSPRCRQPHSHSSSMPGEAPRMTWRGRCAILPTHQLTGGGPMKQPNRIKTAMRAGRKAYGYGLTFPSPWVIDILGKLDFDYVFIDGEHGPFDLEQLEDLCRTAERYHLTTFARVPDIGSSTILRYLDRGIMGILGPHIATEVDARQLVRACYFGPLGERSFGGNRGTDYNAGIPDKAAYYREANEQMLVCALLEDVAVLENLEGILAVPGIDLYGIGPNDFAQSLGYPGQLDHPEVVKAKQEITRRIHQAGRRMQADVMVSAGVSDMLLEGGRRILET